MFFNLILFVSICLVYLITRLLNRLNKEKKDELFLLITFVLFFIICGFRSILTGNDTRAYVAFFENVKLLKWESINLGIFDKGYTIFNIVISYFIQNYRVLLLFFSFVFNFVIYFFIRKNSKNYLISSLMYVGMLYFYSSMTMIRQFFAIIIILSAFKYVKEKKFLKFSFWVFIASYFHFTAFVGIIIYFLYNYKLNYKLLILIIIGSLFSFFFLEELIEFINYILGGIRTYPIRNNSFSLANTLYFFVYFVFLLFIYFIIHSCPKEQKKSQIIKSKKNMIKIFEKLKSVSINDFYINIFLVSSILSFISIRMNILSRITIYFTVFELIIIPNVINYLKSVILRKTIIILIVIFLVLYSTTIIVLRPEWNTAYNYKFCTYDEKCY